QNTLPPSGFLGRWDTERFLIALAYAGRAPLEKIGERLRVLIRCTSVPWWGDHLSIGAWVRMTTGQPDDTLQALRERIETCFLDKQAGMEQEDGGGA
ncbi:MAG TPA: hypothetical protein VJQ82_01580, partial [Terriglobales bacterium]|nr:hypothetical protein [Terriglobales bacterium]